uniref:Uncharacterized protein n=1 Tax=Anguilla anguilla TaxID=7936 RepID=A0A0E9UFX1_ANGAN
MTYILLLYYYNMTCILLQHDLHIITYYYNMTSMLLQHITT